MKAALVSENEGDAHSERAEVRDAGMDSGDHAPEQYEIEVGIPTGSAGEK